MCFRRILGWCEVSDLLTHIERFELVDVDLDIEPQCEGEKHPEATFGHDGGSAAYILLKPCCGGHVLLCRGRVNYMQTKADTNFRCTFCNLAFPASRYRFIEL